MTDGETKAGKAARKRLGGAHPRAKLTEGQVREILARWASERITQAALGAEYGVSEETVRGILAGRSWRHVPRPGAERPESSRDEEMGVE